MKKNIIRYKCVKAILALIFGPLLRMKYNFHCRKNDIDLKQNYLILSNHVTTLDPFIVLNSFSNPIFYVCTEDLFTKGIITKIIKYLANPIRKKKNYVDISAVKNIMLELKKGNNVGLFVEGNRTYDGRLCSISPSITKLIKKIKTPVILFNIIGGYGSDPRWGNSRRKGYLESKIARILTRDEIDSLTENELYQLIIQNLIVDEFNLPYLYKSKRKAEKLERLFYICPICHKISTLKSNGNNMICSNCGLKLEYTEKLQFIANFPEFKFKTIPEWYDYQIQCVKEKNINDQFLYKDNNIELYEVNGIKTKRLLDKATIYMNNKSITFKNSKSELVILLSDISSMAMQLKTKMVIYSDDHTYFVNSKYVYNGIKYMQMYYHIANIIKGEKDEYFGI